MTNDPLIHEVIRIIKYEESELIEAMQVSLFSDLYQVGRAQGRLQGLRRARLAIDEAAKQLYEEDK